MSLIALTQEAVVYRIKALFFIMIPSNEIFYFQLESRLIEFLNTHLKRLPELVTHDVIWNLKIIS